jgi:hypothetical protein
MKLQNTDLGLVSRIIHHIVRIVKIWVYIAIHGSYAPKAGIQSRLNCEIANFGGRRPRAKGGRGGLGMQAVVECNAVQQVERLLSRRI